MYALGKTHWKPKVITQLLFSDPQDDQDDSEDDAQSSSSRIDSFVKYNSGTACARHCRGKRYSTKR